MSRTRSMVTSAVLLCLGTTAAAHEFWLQPASFHPKVGEVVPFRLFVGDTFPGEAVARNPPRIEKFVVSGPDGGEMPIVGRAGRDPAGMMRFPVAGTFVAIYDSTHAFVSVEPEKFEAYLKDKGLEAPAKARRERSQTDTPGREIYSRCAKTILSVGDGPKTGFDRDFGMRLEIIPEAHPATLTPGGELPAHITFEGKPLANATVIAMHPGSTDAVRTTTDSSGHFSLPISSSGMWLVSSVHMVPAPPTNPTGETADWESVWASLTFEVQSATPAEPVKPDQGK